MRLRLFHAYRLLLEDRRQAGLDHGGQLRRVPIGEADTTVRCRVPDPRGLGRSVNSVMLFREIDPNDADGIIRARVDGRLLVGSLGVPEEVGVVVEDRIAADAADFPIAY